MKPLILYLAVSGHFTTREFDSKPWIASWHRFYSSLLKTTSSNSYELRVISTNGGTAETWIDKETGGGVQDYSYAGGGRDVGAFMSVSQSLDLDRPTIYVGANSYFHREGWMERLLSAYESDGPGIYSPMASFEGIPHLRTNLFLTEPKLLLDYPYSVESARDAYRFEHGPQNVSLWALSRGFSTRLVDWRHSLALCEWRSEANIFRRGDQSNCMVWDRHTDIYFESKTKQKRSLELRANGEMAPESAVTVIARRLMRGIAKAK